MDLQDITARDNFGILWMIWLTVIRDRGLLLVILTLSLSFGKTGGRPFACSSKGGLRGFINNSDLVDIGFNDNAFTWKNGQPGNTNIKGRIDKCLAN